MERTLTAFAGDCWIATGDDAEIRAALSAMGEDAQNILLFDDTTGRQTDIDLRGPADDSPRGRGRPKLGVQPREVTLLPRHWDWLAAQPGGASVALRRLVEEARKVSSGDDRRRAAQEATFRFMQAMAGDLPGFEEASRALFAGAVSRFEEQVARWADDVRDHATWLATDAFGS